MTEYYFDSIAHLLNDLEGAQRKSDFGNSSEGVEDGKYDSKTFEQAKKWITEGRELDTLNLSDINHDFLNINNSYTYKEFNNVAGSYVNIGNFLSGSPDCMVDSYQEEAENVSRILKININMAVGFKIRSHEIVEAGKKILEAVNNLEAQGYSTEINCIATIKDKGRRVNNEFCLKVKVKNAGEPLNVNTFFSCVSTDFLRRFYFAFCEKLLKGESKKFADTYGHVLATEGTIRANAVIREYQSTEQIIEQILKANTNQLN